MKVLILGAKGMLGQELVRVFGEKHDVTAWDKDELDVTDSGRVKAELQKLRPDLVINAVAYNDVDGAQDRIEVAKTLNGYVVGNLANLCQHIGAIMIHFSTDYVFDGRKKDGYLEVDSPSPISAYGRSKRLGEERLDANTKRYYLIRLSRLFGKPGAGKKSAVDVMLERLKTEGVINAPDAELSGLTYAPDLAQAVLDIVESEMPFGIYHATNEGAITWFGLAQEIVRATGQGEAVKVDSDAFVRAAKRPQFSVLLNTKLPPMRPWQDALKEYLATK